jgi:hypothetical protein
MNANRFEARDRNAARRTKLQYTVVLDGEPVTFSSTRQITHAVIGKRVDGQIEIVATSGSRELAEKALRTQVSYLSAPKWAGPSHGDTIQKQRFGSADAFSVVTVESR